MEAALSQAHGEQGLDFSLRCHLSWSPLQRARPARLVALASYWPQGPQVLSQALPLTCYVTV